MKKWQIRAILLDVGGVLALGGNSKWKKGKFIPSGVHLNMAKKLKVSIDQYLDSIDTAYVYAITGKLSPKKVLEILSQNFGISSKKLKKFYLDSYKKNFKQNKKLFNKLFELKKQGYKIAVLSDQWFLSKEALMPEKLYKNFDELIVSCDVGVRKPNQKIYQLAVKKLNLSSKEILFIDNQKWNLEPAKKLGINVILFKSNKQLFKEKLWRNLFKK
ncbi:HAD-IA family hydrolase [Candidatus Pacearchaeota archaeon]|nr:HAD-IA family hydrolase [Candidatus Pacearchaeota archaeon]